ncbi:hypothetical protein GCM10011412_15830 [Maribacter cobaltidurans]|nr:hypothetical protein GCM10011412_15830 [Maribacter cobaltidurans]
MILPPLKNENRTPHTAINKSKDVLSLNDKILLFQQLYNSIPINKKGGASLKIEERRASAYSNGAKMTDFHQTET